jgi:heptosyltransferase-2
MGHRILIIKLGALGDVIRTAAILPALLEDFAPCHITWISRPAGCRMLANHPMIDRLLPFDMESLCHLEHERFDLVLSLDKEPGPAALAMRVDCPDKRGMGLSPSGTVFPLNAEARHYFALGLSDRLKFQVNERSYPQLIHAALGIEDRGQPYTLHPTSGHHAYAAEVFSAAGVSGREPIVGLNTGAGHVFANKTWPPEKFEALARRLLEQGGCRVALLGGPGEHARNQALSHALGPAVIHTGCDHSELEFAAIIARCSVVVSGDTTAMHVAVATKVPVVALFGPTCAQEIDLFDCGSKVVSNITCSPCYRRYCDETPNCMDLIEIDRVAEAVETHLKTASSRLHVIQSHTIAAVH